MEGVSAGIQGLNIPFPANTEPVSRNSRHRGIALPVEINLGINPLNQGAAEFHGAAIGAPQPGDPLRGSTYQMHVSRLQLSSLDLSLRSTVDRLQDHGITLKADQSLKLLSRSCLDSAP